jgi:hypothetical protein
MSHSIEYLCDKTVVALHRKKQNKTTDEVQNFPLVRIFQKLTTEMIYLFF